MPQAQYDIVYLGLQALFLLAVPVVVAVSLAGTIAAVLQSATSIQDPALGYTARLLALLLVLYLVLPSTVDIIISLARTAFG